MRHYRYNRHYDTEGVLIVGLIITFFMACASLVISIMTSDVVITKNDIDGLEMCLDDKGKGEKCVLEVEFDDNGEVKDLDVVRLTY